jgi:transposase-like protein
MATYSLEDKKNAIALAKMVGVSQTAKQLGISNSTVRIWLKNKSLQENSEKNDAIVGHVVNDSIMKLKEVREKAINKMNDLVDKCDEPNHLPYLNSIFQSTSNEINKEEGVINETKENHFTQMNTFISIVNGDDKKNKK